MKHLLIHFARMLTAAVLCGLAWEAQAQLLTSPEGFRIVVNEASKQGLRRVNFMPDYRFKDGYVRFTVPSNVFWHNDKNAIVTLNATQANGRTLPAWLRFNPKTGEFYGSPERRPEVVFITISVKDNLSEMKLSDSFVVAVER